MSRKKKPKLTLVVNLFAGPGAGKSGCMGGVFSELKANHVDCEQALEYAKDCVWNGNIAALDDQLDIYANQRKRILNLIGKVDVVITDSPLLNSIVYDKHDDKLLQQIVLRDHNKLNNLNFFIVRVKKYMRNGRVQSKAQAVVLDENISEMLRKNNCPFEVFGPDDKHIIARKVIDKLNELKCISKPSATATPTTRRRRTL